MCGPKNMIEGHRLRHRIFNLESNIKIPTKFYYKGDYVDVKRNCWKSMYHIAVENSQNTGYFTEKIIESFMTKTIPVYWGCPNIHEFFDMNGVICFENEHDMLDKINTLTPEVYLSKMEAIETNYKLSLQYANIFQRMSDAIYEFCKINSI